MDWFEAKTDHRQVDDT